MSSLAFAAGFAAGWRAALAAKDEDNNNDVADIADPVVNDADNVDAAPQQQQQHQQNDDDVALDGAGAGGAHRGLFPTTGQFLAPGDDDDVELDDEAEPSRTGSVAFLRSNLPTITIS